VEQAVRRFGRLDVLVNNAGAGLFASVEDTTDDDLARILDLNFKGTLHGIQAALPVMRRQGAGHIINVASTAGRRGSPYVGAYCASKFAVVGLTESLRVELRGGGIDVTLVCPGATRTEFFDVARRRTPRHGGLVGPVESAEDVAARIADVVRRPRAEVLAQPLRRKPLLALNVLAPGLVDRLVACLIDRKRSA
jgi:short-subunit dehydrogenase